MALITYTDVTPSSTASRPRRRRLFGTAHNAPHWANAIRLLRASVLNASEHAPYRPKVTADRVGTFIIDEIDGLDVRSLQVLAATVSTLVRASRRYR